MTCSRIELGRASLLAAVAAGDLAGRGLAEPVAKAFTSGHVPWEAIFRAGRPPDGVDLDPELDDEALGVDGVAGQRAFVRSTAAIRVIVAGRQAGKTHQAAEEVVRLILARPDTESCLLMPTYKSTKGALRHLERALKPIRHLVTWKEVDKVFVFSNGAKLYLRTADDKTGVPTRGLTLDGVLWVDEASFVPRSAWNAAQATQTAVADPKTIVTTTPRGRKSWVFELCVSAADDEDVEFFRFRSTDSPHVNRKFVERLRERLGRKVADEELSAVFLGETDVPFHPDDVARAFSHGREDGSWAKLPIRGEQLTIGLDLAKKRDYTVAVLMNEFGESWVIDRFRADTFGGDRTFWPRAKRRLVELANKHSAIVVLDVGQGGGFGGSMHDHLVEELGDERVFAVKTGNRKIKAKLIEDLISDFEADRLKIGDGDHASALHDELLYFPRPVRTNEGGVEVLVYPGPSDDDDEHDDTVIALSLARWGRVHAWEETQDPLAGDFSGFVAPRGLGGGRRSASAVGQSRGLGGFGGAGLRR